MKVEPQAKVLLDALLQVREIVDEESATAPWAKRIRRVVKAALDEAAKPDPLMAAAVALARSVEVLEGELRAAADALKAGQMWVCIETPQRLEQARGAIAAARAAGVQL